MRDEKPGDRTERASAKAERRKRSALVYLVILFAAAFLMLLLAYFMQQRNSAEIIGNLSDLRESMGNIQSIDQLVEENRALREENEGLKGQLAALEQEYEQQKEIAYNYWVELDGITDTLSNVYHNLESRETAMGLFWQLDEAYVTGDYEFCRELISRLEGRFGEDLFWYLSEPNGENGFTRSTGERYREIVAALPPPAAEE